MSSNESPVGAGNRMPLLNELLGFGCCISNEDQVSAEQKAKQE